MGGAEAHISEIRGCGHDTATKMVVPNPVHHDASSEGVLWIN